MIKRILTYIALLLFILFIPFGNINENAVKLYPFKELFPLTGSEELWVDSVMNSMILRDKCAQLVFPYAYGKDTIKFSKNYDRLIKLVTEENVGGVIFFQGDIENQTAIINKLQSVSKIPLLISSDFERGLGMRLDDAVEFPFKMAFAAAGNPYYDYLMGKITGSESRLIGRCSA